MFNAFRGSGLKTRLLHPIDEFWDLRLGVQTVGFLPEVGLPGAPEWRGAYVPTKYKRILASLRHVNVGTNDAFVDLGCGLGRAVFAASWLGAKRAIGVEIDASLSDQARRSHERSRLNGRDIEFVCAGAETFSPVDTTVLFMFNPFGPGTMQTVIRRFEEEMAKNPRPLRVVYENPLQSAVLDASPYLKRFDEWPSGKHGSPHPVAFWEANDPGH